MSVKKGAVDGDVLDCAGRGVDAEVVGFEEVAEPVAVDEVDGRGAVPGGFFLGVGGECAGGDQQALVAAAPMAPRKSRTALGLTLPR
jgi:hypothetical protein